MAPLSAVTLEYLLLLPISAIVGYHVHHRVSLTKTPWFNDNGLQLHEVHDAIRALHRLPRKRKCHMETDGHGSVSQLNHVLLGGHIPVA